jgi:hypothetical protein
MNGYRGLAALMVIAMQSYGFAATQTALLAPMAKQITALQACRAKTEVANRRALYGVLQKCIAEGRFCRWVAAE